MEAYRRVRTPTVLQMEAVECGAASLAIVLGFHGRFVPLEQLRVDCGVSRDGSKATNILKAARAHGLQGQGFRLQQFQLRGTRPPFIVFWTYSHFMVVEGVDRSGRVHLNDPACGPRSLSADEFAKGYSGVALVLEPGPDFHKGGQRPRLLNTLRVRLRGSETGLLYVVLVSLLLVGPGLAQPLFVRVFVDDLLAGREETWLLPLLTAIAGTAVVTACLTWLQQSALLRLETRLSLSSSARFLWHVLRLPVEFYTQRYAGEVGSRVAINDQVAQLLSGELATSILNVLVVVFYAAVMVAYDPVLAAVGVLIALFNLGALALVSRRRKDGYQRLLQERAKLMSTSMGCLAMIETIKASGTEREVFANWAGCQAAVLNVQQRLGLYDRILLVVPPLLSTLASVLVLAAGGYRVMQGVMSIGMLVAFQAFMHSFLGPVQQLVGLGTSLQEAEGGMNRLEDVLHSPAEVHRPGLPEVRLTGRLELRNVTFGYNRLEAPLLEDFSLHLEPGRRVAVVGATGSGKSTLARLVCGLYPCWSGEVLFDGKRREEIPSAALCDGMSVVDQDILLFAGTIRENLTLWDDTVAEAELVQAAQDAEIHEEICRRPGDYHSLVAEGGANFSGGQRQRLEIARALVGNPSLLVLDEATSALDPVVEKRIDENLRRRGCACFIIAHRLSTIRDCDEIIVLDQGKVACRGSHRELLQHPHYAALVASELGG